MIGVRHSGRNATMDATDHDDIQPEPAPFQEICPRHGERTNRQHGCPKCVMEEVRRHERRMHLPLEFDAPVELEHDAPLSAGVLSNSDPLSIEIG